ncbi:hypothetical protein RA231_000309 [Cronobacter turicensis]|nr:hypothetical protein [Cronobacter turicensis]EKY1992324.1 hypothetical protein [Cronobacter turicensis]
MSTISNERLEKLSEYDCADRYEVMSMATELLALRKERERAEPVGEVVLGSRDDEGNYPHAHVICLAGEGCADWDNFPDGFKLYTAPPAPVAPDEKYQHLSELYHGQEKRLFKIAQRIKGPSFDKYAYSPSQAIDVLEAAIFGENNKDCRAAMLQSAQAETDTTTQQFESLAGKAVSEDASSMADAHMAWLNTNFPRNAYSDEEWEEVSLYTWLAWRDSQRNACFPGT